MNEFAPHGSPAGFEAGCHTRASCPHHGSETMLTCVEAAIRRRGDYHAWKVPIDQPLPRKLLPPDFSGSRSSEELRRKHGTPWGYQRGCRTRMACPNWHLGKTSCADARRTYIESYKKRRRSGEGSEIQHGTAAGYSAGCHGTNRCPRDSEAKSCADAWREYKLRKAREAGVRPRETADVGSARAAVRELQTRGYSLRSIADLTGVGRTTIGELLRSGRHLRDRRFSKDVVDRLTSVILAHQES